MDQVNTAKKPLCQKPVTAAERQSKDQKEENIKYVLSAGGQWNTLEQTQDKDPVKKYTNVKIVEVQFLTHKNIPG